MWLGKVTSTPVWRAQCWHGANLCCCQLHVTQSIACPNSFILHSQLFSSTNQSTRVTCGVVLSQHKDLSPKRGVKGASNSLDSYFPRHAEEAQCDSTEQLPWLEELSHDVTKTCPCCVAALSMQDPDLSQTSATAPAPSWLRAGKGTGHLQRNCTNHPSFSW